MGLTWPVSLLFWHAPALTLWARLPLGKALFFSAIASWRNLGAFVVFGATWLLAHDRPGRADPGGAAGVPPAALANMLTFAGVLWPVSCFYASLYFSVVDCFEGSQPGDAAEPIEPDQF